MFCPISFPNSEVMEEFASSLWPLFAFRLAVPARMGLVGGTGTQEEKNKLKTVVKLSLWLDKS